MHARARWVVLVSAVAALVLVTSCARKYQKIEESLEQPINCATARQYIKTLQGQKVSKGEEAAVGMSYALPTTVFIGALTGAGGAQYEVGTGEFNRKIDERIADVRVQCKVD
jgi:hypothetical protein